MVDQVIPTLISQSSAFNVTGGLTVNNVNVSVGTTVPVGMWSPSVNTLALNTNSSQVVTILSTGNLGIGTATPLTTLQVGGNMNANNFTTDPNGVISSMNKTISTVYTIPTNQNAFSVGNIQLAPGANVTVQPGTRWVII
jgi:hypothetical protein